MLDRIIDILKANKDISDWKIVQNETEANELFLIKKQVDMPRSKKINSIAVTIYKDFEEDGRSFRGSSTIHIHPTMTDEEIQEAIAGAVFSASFVRNLYYPLPGPANSKPQALSSRYDSASLVEWMPKIKEALYKHDSFRNGYINSSEIFLNKIRTSIINSRGLEHSFNSYKGYIEFVTSWKELGEEIELFRELSFSDFDPNGLSETAKEMLELSKEKAATQPTPNLESATVILYGTPVAEIMKYYYLQANTQAVYQQISTVKPFESIQGEEIHGDAVTLTLDPALANSAVSSPVDEDGVVLSAHRIIEGGVLQKYWGNTQYSYYLDVEPTGKINNLVFEEGSKTIEEMRAVPHLEIAAFSDLSMDFVTGDFAGEIRLGWYFDGNSRITISGGSISGNLRNMHNNMYLSKEIQQCTAKEGFLDLCYKGPKALMLHNVSVAGN